MRERWLFTILLPTLLGASLSAQEVPANPLSPYLVPYSLTRLEFELLNFNMLWHDSYDGSAEYANSSPVIYHADRNVFFALVRVQDKRSYDDRQPFLSLSSTRQRIILNGVVESLRDLLALSFPEVEQQDNLLEVEFEMRSRTGATTIASFRNGLLVLHE